MIDLKATNEKLKDRAIRIVSQLANVDNSAAFEKLTQCDWRIKTAIVSLIKKVSVEDAENELKSYCGVLRRVLGEKTVV